MSDANVSPHFESGAKGENVWNSNSYLLAYHLKASLTRKIITIRRGFYYIPSKNGGLLMHQHSNLYRVPFRTGLT